MRTKTLVFLCCLGLLIVNIESRPNPIPEEDYYDDDDESEMPLIIEEAVAIFPCSYGYEFDNEGNCVKIQKAVQTKTDYSQWFQGR